MWKLFLGHSTHSGFMTAVLIEGKYFSSENFLFRILIFYYDLRSGRCFNEFSASFPSRTRSSSFSTKIRGSGKLKLISHMEYVARSCVSWQRKDGAEVISKKIMTGTLPVPWRFLL